MDCLLTLLFPFVLLVTNHPFTLAEGDNTTSPLDYFEYRLINATDEGNYTDAQFDDADGVRRQFIGCNCEFTVFLCFLYDAIVERSL